MIKYLTALAIAAIASFGISSAALSDAGGIGVGATAGTYSASAQSGAIVGGVILGGQVGTFRQTAGTQSYSSAGMGIGVSRTVSVAVAFDGLNNGSIAVTRSSTASVEGFGTAGSQSFTEYAGDGFQAGLGLHGAQSSGAANAAGAFGGIAIIAANTN